MKSRDILIGCPQILSFEDAFAIVAHSSASAGRESAYRQLRPHSWKPPEVVGANYGNWMRGGPYSLDMSMCRTLISPLVVVCVLLSVGACGSSEEDAAPANRQAAGEEPNLP